MRSFGQKARDTALKLGISIQRNYQMPLELILDKIWPVEINDDLLRIGSLGGDGGYLVPASLLRPNRVFSPGVATNSDFENFFLARQIPCHLLDGSVDFAPLQNELMTFEKKWLTSFTSLNSWSLDDWVHHHAQPGEELMLQMDIEGHEFEVLISTNQSTLDRFKVIVVELHGLSMAANRDGLRLVNLLLDKLLASHRVVHAHPNNCCSAIKLRGLLWPQILELTLVHRDQTQLFTDRLAHLPHELDRPNTRARDLKLRIKK